MRSWRNWQTRKTKDLVVHTMQVQFLSTAPKKGSSMSFLFSCPANSIHNSILQTVKKRKNMKPHTRRTQPLKKFIHTKQMRKYARDVPLARHRTDARFSLMTEPSMCRPLARLRTYAAQFRLCKAWKFAMQRPSCTSWKSCWTTSPFSQNMEICYAKSFLARHGSHATQRRLCKAWKFAMQRPFCTSWKSCWTTSPLQSTEICFTTPLGYGSELILHCAALV